MNDPYQPGQESYFGRQLLDTVEDCRVFRKVDYEFPDSGAEKLGVVTVKKGETSYTLTSEGVSGNCLVEPDDAAFEAGNYQVHFTGSPEVPELTLDVVVPEKPSDVDHSEFEAGADMLVTWQSVGADSMRIDLDGGDIEIQCVTDDDGELIIPGGATMHVSADSFLSVRSRIKRTELYEEDLWTSSLGQHFSDIDHSR